MLCTSISKRINKEVARKLVNYIGEDKVFPIEFKTEKSFDEYFFEMPDTSFAQIGCNLYFGGLEPKDRLSLVCTSIEEAKDFKDKVININNQMKKFQEDILAESNLTTFEKDTYRGFYRVGYELGYCNLRVISRNKKEEETEAREDYLEHKRRYETDAKYKADYDWTNENHRPFGGAFSSTESYEKYRN